jgi:uncharacterized protein YdaU (DUF1376 family)
MHYFQFHIGDYKSHTHHLSLLEDLAFRRLLDHYYLHEIPIKQREIARQIGMREHEQEVLTVLEEFFVSTEKGYINPRADDEIAKYRKFIEDGKRGAAKRWLKGDDSPPIATPIATINHKPITINQEPKKKATSVACPDGVVDDVWQDWLQLRKAKKAPVTQTVVNSAIKEAEKAGISLNAFLTIWCARGSQGLQAEWLKPNERQPFANKYDVAHVTTPPPPNQDAALRKIEEDRKKAVPPSLETLARLAELRKGVV